MAPTGLNAHETDPRPLQQVDPVAAYRRLQRTALAMRRRMRRLYSSYGLTGAQYGLLARIPEGGIPLTQLAETAWSDPGNTSSTVDRLAREGWVNRSRSETDRRVVIVHLSEKARALLAEIAPRYEEAVAEMMGALAPEEVTALDRLLARLETGLSEGASPGRAEQDQTEGGRS